VNKNTQTQIIGLGGLGM